MISSLLLLVTRGADNFYDKVFIYTINRETKKLRRLGEIKKDTKNNTICSFSSCNISWEGNLITYGVVIGYIPEDLNDYDVQRIFVMNYDGSNNHLVVSYKLSEPDFGLRSLPLTLSGDCQKVFYIKEREKDLFSLYSINLDGTGNSLVSDLCPDSNRLRYEVKDMMWDSRGSCIILISDDVVRNGVDPPYNDSQINPDGTNLRAVEPEYLEEYKRRKIYDGMLDYKRSSSVVHGLLESELEEMTRNITYAEWGVPSPYSH